MAALPQWIRPQLTQLVDPALDGDQWQIRRLPHACPFDRGAVKLLTRTGLDWTHRYPAIAAAVASPIAGSGARSNASTARNLSWSAGPIRKEAAFI
jgi:hypothetical protein